MLGSPAGGVASVLRPSALKFDILNQDATEVIGHSHYESRPGDHDVLIGSGAAHFKNGEYDIEYDVLKAQPDRPPVMLSLDHKFYNADGSLQRAIAADFRTGQASCTQYRNGLPLSDSAQLDFGSDSYGGLAIVLALQEYLEQGSTGPLRLRVLGCIPKPRLIAVAVGFRQPSRWSHYPGQTIEVDITPDLGWFGALVAPFLPQLRAWFDPSDGWSLAGGELARYFRGPRIMLVRETQAELRAMRAPAGGD
jgi:hypothetical protein